MIFTPTKLAGAYLVEPERHEDERGFFARVWCRQEAERRDLTPEFDQVSVSHNLSRGTLRGMHWQAAPHGETKLVRCSRGALFDVLADVRPSSPTWGEWVAAELTADNGRMYYIPPGIAHGFLTLEAQTEVTYHISGFYEPCAARGARFDDPALSIRWPRPVEVIAPRDLEWPRLSPSPERK